ncbi:type VII secretion target [Aeromicrobium fastidiosum]|uniref:Uncharacterized protein n=1 Tax=Aeromicrobium fastidiosum TaxID=52699 RepID=A0A641AR23_9ACTN|nr:type VII secretion target [Aeromicrobium fastidiosum]KAA1380540.1 hypothetical protein ESP62_005010 [Aeromicrobium fastidiosum]MBP2390133.1 hypothetical protein [Aeromicrobium fastidiosum]
MNLRVDTDVVRGGGKQVQTMADRLVSTFSSAESSLRAAADDIGQPALETALAELLTTLKRTHPQIATNLGAFASEVTMAADAIDQTDIALADSVPETP